MNELQTTRSIVQSLKQAIIQMTQRKQKPPRWDPTRHGTVHRILSRLVLSADQYSLAPWAATADGIPVIQEIMTITFTALVPTPKQSSPARPSRTTVLSQSQSVPEPEESVPEQVSVSTPELVPAEEPEQVPSLPSSPAPSPPSAQTSPSPPPVSSKKKDSDSEVETEDESMDEEEWKETEEREVEEATGRSHRTVTSRMLQRMKVGADDMLIRTRGNSHPVFINVTRLQQLIREEGGMLEN